MRRIFRLSHTARRAPEIDQWMREQPDALRAIAQHWFGVMRACGDDVREAIHDDQPTACIGDAAFDPTFVVRARDPGRLERILPPDLRARLLATHERTPLLVDDLGLRVASDRLPAAAEIPGLLRGLAGLAGEIEARVRDEGGSPYR